MNLQHKTMLAVAEIAELYLDESDQRPWVIAWSGGKDSTTVLKLTAQALQMIPHEKRKRQVYAVMSDTKMENPELELYMHRQVDLVNQWAFNNKIPLEAHTVYRDENRSFFYLIVGKGYPLPNSGNNRWCTHSLKIEPQDKFIKEKDPALVFLGVRTDESARRAASIERWKEEGSERFGNHYSLPSITTYMPIVHFTTEEVWELLMMPLPWGSSEDIRRLYREATGECVLVNAAGVDQKAADMTSCSARFGCWVCPPITKDKSTENMSQIHEWMTPLTAFRKFLIATYKNKDNKCGYMRNGKYLGPQKGTLGLAARFILLEELLSAQERLNELRADTSLESLTLIEDYEVQMIRKQWAEDAVERPWLLGNNVNQIEEQAATTKEEV